MRKLYIFAILGFIFSCTSENINTNPTPSITQTASISPTATQTPSISPSPTISPDLTPDISSNATLTGKVYDQNGNFLSDATVILEYNNKKFETKTILGSYVFRDLPTGEPIKVTAYKGEEYISKSQNIVLKSNLTGNTNLNNLDFGDLYPDNSIRKQNFFFLTNTPEVSEILLNNSNRYITKHYDFSIKLIFNKVVEKKSVIDNLLIRSLNNKLSASTIIDDSTDNLLYKCIIDHNTSGVLFTWDTGDYNEYGKELNISFTKASGLVVDNEKDIYYGLTLRGNNGSIFLTSKDKIQALDSGDFFINNERRKNFIFTVVSDKTEPELDKIDIDNNNSKKQIRLFFSEPMTFLGNFGFNSTVLDINNYIFYKNNSVFSLTNPVLKMLDSTILEIEADNISFSDNDTIKIEVKPFVRDPAGNFFSRGQKNGDWNYIRTDLF